MITSIKIPFLQFDKKRAILGTVLAAITLAVCGIWFSLSRGLLYAAMFLAAGLVKLRTKHPLVSFALHLLWGMACIFLSCWISTIMITSHPAKSFLFLNRFRIIMNCLCAAVIYGLVLAATGKIKPAILIASGMLVLLCTANAFVYQFRSSELKPMDFLSIGTAMNVVGQYTFQIKSTVAYGWILWVWLAFSLGCLPEEIPLLPRLWLRLASLAAVAACVFVIWKNYDNVPVKNWVNHGSTMNGYFLNFTLYLRGVFINKPEGYSPDAVKELEAQYSADNSMESGEMPNIIVIMNESFADMKILGENFRTNQPVTPFFDSLEENAIKGYALASIFGGNTANSEFEFLTGHSMAWLPQGSVAYQQYVHSSDYSFAHLMNRLGYTTTVTHPYVASGWNRPKVYPAYGFQSSTFQEAYPNAHRIRDYISDQEMYDYVLNVLDQTTDSPLFLFGITMQNHGSYDADSSAHALDFDHTIYLEGYSQEYPDVETYLSLINASDKATEQLLEKLETYPEKTLVVFFGDHFPRLSPSFYDEVHGGEYETLSQQMLQYTVPFFIWANYDIPEQTVACTSLSYLSRYVLEAAGMELPAYHQFLKEMEAAIPAVSAMGYYSRAQETFLPLTDAEGEEARWLNLYNILQYNAMFDEDGRSHAFFGQYLPTP